MHGPFHCAIWGSGWPGWDRHNHESCRCEGMQVNISCDPIEQLFGWWVFNMFPTLAPLIALRTAPGLEIVADVLETEVLFPLFAWEFHHRISESSASELSQSTRIFLWLCSVWRYSPDTLFDLTAWLHFHKALLFQQKPTEDGSMVHGSVKPVRFCLDCVLWETLEETRKLQSNAIKDLFSPTIQDGINFWIRHFLRQMAWRVAAKQICFGWLRRVPLEANLLVGIFFRNSPDC